MSSQSFNVSNALPIAGGIVPPFEPIKLNNGDLSQLDNWVHGAGSSIYVQWVPDELNEQFATTYFTNMNIGKVDRVEFVPKYDANRKQIGRMMFVHFEHWYSLQFAKQVARLHPEPFESAFILGKFKSKQYFLKCRINCRPVAKVEYNTHQLTDMFERLNERVMAEIAALRSENASLKIMIEELKKPSTTAEVPDVVEEEV